MTECQSMPGAAQPAVTESGTDEIVAAPNAGRTERHCSVARTVGILSDPWMFLVIREAFFGAKRFETFQSSLGVPRATLTDRLGRLIEEGILVRSRIPDAKRHEYKLTAAGLDLYPSFIALMQFGDRWLLDGDEPPLRLVDSADGHVIEPIVACSHCHGEINAHRVTYRDGPGAGASCMPPSKRTRRPSDPGLFERGRPSSVAKSLQVIGDRWSFLVIREAFFGRRRFDHMQVELGIASNILADRLARLVQSGVFRRDYYDEARDRVEYRLTDMGLDLYGPLVAMLAWGDRWLADGKPPLVLHHLDCGHDFSPVVICRSSRRAVTAHGLRYRMSYTASDYEGPLHEGRETPARST